MTFSGAEQVINDVIDRPNDVINDMTEGRGGVQNVINDVIGVRNDVINDILERGLQNVIGNVIDDVILCEPCQGFWGGPPSKMSSTMSLDVLKCRLHPPEMGSCLGEIA